MLECTGMVGDLCRSSLPPALLMFSRMSFPKMLAPFIRKLNTHWLGVRLKGHVGQGGHCRRSLCPRLRPVSRHTTRATEMPGPGC